MFRQMYHKPITYSISLIGSLAGWLAVLLQLYLLLASREVTLGEALVRFFSFFTILTNLAVAWCYTLQGLSPASGAGRFFARHSVQSALLIYIGIVGLVYNLVLRKLWEPQGIQQLVDEMLHVFTPLWFLLYWIVKTDKVLIPWQQAFGWLLYPFVYMLFTLLRGVMSGFYPYPFMDVDTLGLVRVLMHCSILFCIFLGFSLLLIAVNNGWIKRRQQRMEQQF